MPVDENMEDGFAFAVPDLYKTSNLAHFDDTAHVMEDLQPLLSLEEPQLELPFSKEVKSGLLDVPTFEYGPVEDVGVLEDSSVVSLESLNPPETVEEDVWTSLQSSKSDATSANLKSWEGFYRRASKAEPSNLYLSEGGPQLYDAALVRSVPDGDHELVASSAGIVIQLQALLSSLIQLALGRESRVYYYNEEERSFQPRKRYVRMSGYSLQTFDSLRQRLQETGNAFRDLQRFVSDAQRSSTACRTYVALAAAFSPILASLEAQIACPSLPTCSLLQLQGLVERPGQVLQCLSNVVEKMEGAQTDEQLLAKLFEVVQSNEQSPAWMSQILQGLLKSASRPWLDSVESWLGLQHKGHFGFPASFPAFTKARKSVSDGDNGFSDDVDGFEFDPSSVPSFVSNEDAESIFETGRCLRLLIAHQPHHPLTRQYRPTEDDPAKLEWQFTWEDIETIAAKANAYESNLRRALKDFYSNSPAMEEMPFQGQHTESVEHASPNHPKQSAQSFIKSSTALFEQPLPNISHVQSSQRDFDDVGESSAFAPPISLLSTLSINPITSACARLVNHASLRLLFETYHLRTHLSLLHRFILMSDGVFISRLSHTLFSPDLSTTEWRPGQSRSGHLGLKLGHRDVWPPASSELRLALTGMIADSYFTSTSRLKERSIYSTNLPGDISFAIRPMSPDELKKCSDPNALFALDFLRIQYTPTAPLDSIITPNSLEKYDSISRLLLRCSRMLFVVTQLNSPPQRPSARVSSATFTRDHRHIAFRNESRHFVSTICHHFFNNVSSHYQHLDQKLATLESAVMSELDHTSSDNPAATEAETAGISSIPALRAFHQHLLDSTMLALLLRKRQEQVMALLEEIWGLVLRFAWLVNSRDEGSADLSLGSGARPSSSSTGTTGEEIDTEIRLLHAQFRRKARVFVEVCRGLGERAPKDKDREMAGVGVGMEQLVGMFDMNGFYMRA